MNANKKIEELKSYILHSLSNFGDSFKSFDMTIVMIVLYKLLFYGLCVFLTFTWRDIVIKKGAVVASIDPNLLRLGPGPHLESISASIKLFYGVMIGYALLFAAIALLAYIIFNFLIWARITGTKLKKVKRPFALKFLLLNILWVFGLVAIFYVSINSVKPEAMVKWLGGVVLVYSHLITIMYISYFKRGKAAKAARKAFDVGFTKIHHFIVPYALAGAVFALLNAILSPFQRVNYALANPDVMIAAGLIVFMFYGAWLKIYIYSFAKKLV